MANTAFADAYPAITQWVMEFGCIEIGTNDFSQSLIRVLDIGGMHWEGGDIDTPLDIALQTAETVVARLIRELE